MKMQDDKLLTIVSQVLLIERDEITDSLKRKDYEPWDSMAHLMLISEVENQFDIFFEDDEIVEIWTVADLKKVLSTKLS
jgi:acyl carrier protein